MKATKKIAQSNSWHSNLLSFFRSHTQKVFTKTELQRLIDTSRYHLGTPQSLPIARVIPVLEEEGELRTVDLPPVLTKKTSTPYLPIRRYVWGEVSPYTIALSLRKGAYLSHASALFMHGLTTQNPQTVYVNREQSPKSRPSSVLTQESIDRAFRAVQRKSNYIYRYGDYRFVLLSGKHTNQLGVVEVPGPDGQPLSITQLERTLIDIAVRPTYAGGVFQVLQAFREARDRISAETLTALLNKLNYTYPYHQSLGFYMERANYDPTALVELKKLGLQHDFYLAHKMTSTKYDTTWRLFYPEGL